MLESGNGRGEERWINSSDRDSPSPSINQITVGRLHTTAGSAELTIFGKLLNSWG